MVEGDRAGRAAGRARPAVPALVHVHVRLAAVGVDGQRVERADVHAQRAPLDAQRRVDGHRGRRFCSQPRARDGLLSSVGPPYCHIVYRFDRHILIGVILHWFLPTNGDSRTDLSLGNAVGAAGSRITETGTEARARHRLPGPDRALGRAARVRRRADADQLVVRGRLGHDGRPQPGHRALQVSSSRSGPG